MTNQRHTSGRQRANDRRPGLAPAVAAIGPPLSQIDGRRSVANIVRACAKRAGFDPNAFSGHSLRAGFLTSAAGKGASIFKMMDVSVTSQWTPCGGYVRDAELFKDHAGAGLL